MKQLAPISLALSLALSPPAMADTNSDVRDGLDLLSEGARTLLEGLAEEMRPMLEQAQPFFEEEVAPFFANLWGLIDDVTAYELPERLPNGDIIIRRSPDAPPLPEPGENGDVEL